jgi:hypothetical protein
MATESTVIPESQPAGSPATTEPAAKSAGSTQLAKEATSDTATGPKPAGQFTYTEDRSKWIPPYRLSEESTKAQRQFEKKVAELEAGLQERDRKIQALAGVTPASPEEAQADEIREAIFQLVPALRKFDDATVDKLLGLVNSAESLSETTNHYWTQHGANALSKLETAVASELGGGDLNERQRKALHRAYVAEAEENPEFLKRHEAGDPKLIEEFAKQWAEDWVEPARRKVTAQAVSRVGRPVPRDKTGQVATKPKDKVDNSDPDAVLDRAVAYLREQGLEFGA